MQAVVYHAPGDIRLEDVPEPRVQAPTDAVVGLTTSAICGTDLPMVRGTMGGMRPGTVLGHEGVGVVQQTGADVRNLRHGDRVVIPSTIGCGNCVYCRAGYYAQCDRANPNGAQAGTAFFGGPEPTGPFDGMQAERVRVPFANAGLVKLPDSVSDEQAIMLSDILPTAWFGAELAEVSPGDTVAVFGCGPVGLFAVQAAWLHGAGRVFAVDGIQSRLEAARQAGAEIVDYSREDPVTTLRGLTGGIGPDRVIDAVGVDAEQPRHGPAAQGGSGQRRSGQSGWQPPGVDSEHVPDQALEWGVAAVAKAGSVGVIGVYPPQVRAFPIGAAMNKNLTLKMGNCNHRRYIPELLGLVRTGQIEPASVLTQVREVKSALDAYDAFGRRADDWIKVALVPASNPAVHLG